MIHESEVPQFEADRRARKIRWLPRGRPESAAWDGIERPETRFWKACPTVEVGDWWTEEINHAERDGEVVAVDPASHQWLWEYVMPAGTTNLVRYGWRRGELGRRVVSYNSLDDRWLSLIREEFFLCNPQERAAGFLARWEEFRCRSKTSVRTTCS